MPGIFGICSGRPSDEIKPVAERMLSVMRHHPWYSSRLYDDPSGHFAGGRVTLADPPAGGGVEREDGEPLVLLDGEIYDYGIRRRELEAEGIRFRTSDHAELIGHGLRQHGPAFLASVEGYFSAAVWRPSDGTLLLASDRFGMKPLYYTSVENGLVFATEIKALLKHPGVSRRRSMRGVAQFFTFGHLLSDDTMFESIRVVPAASVLTYDVRRGAFATERYWRMRQGPLIAGRDEALSSLESAFGRAVERRLVGSAPLGLSLSGGLDARTILAAIPRGSVHVKSMSIGIRGSIDHRAASRLADLAGAEHHCEYLEGDFITRFPVYLRRLVFLTDGHYLDQAITVPTLPVYRDLGIEVLLRGHAGELLHMDKAYAFSIRPDELKFPTVGAVESWLWPHLTAYMIDGIGHDMFAPKLRAEAASLARQSLTDALAQSDDFAPPAQRLWQLFVHERLRRETAMSMQMFNSVVDIRLPYIDADFVEVSMRVPPEVKMGDTVQSFILAQRHPDFLKVVNANTGTTPGAGALQKRLGTTRLRVLSKLGVSGYQPYERLGLWLSQQLQPFVSELLLSDRSLDRGLFDRTAVRQVIEDHRSRRSNHTFLLMAMLIFELGQRQFVDEDPTALAESV